MGRISSITTENDLLYTAGYYVDSGDWLRKACYWVFDVDNPQWTAVPDGQYTDWNTAANRQDLLHAPSGSDSFVHALAVLDGEVYAAGEYYIFNTGESEDAHMAENDPGIICYWANGAFHELRNATEVSGIAAANVPH
ncbi:MAG: hypothetical protein FWD78_02475 [Treponema sp.]|nr:hypothetical protein [Treponema sp.]